MRITDLILIGLLFLVGCGVKGDLQPKGTSEPNAPSFLNLQQQGELIQLSWDIPAINQDGSRLTDLAGFRVNLYSYSADQYCPECKDQETVATVDLEQPEPAIIKNAVVYLRLPYIGADQGARYRVSALTKKGKQGPHVQARIDIKTPPETPVNVKVNAVDRGATLFWTLPDEIQKSGELLGVNIYRSQSDELIAPQKINKAPVKGNNFDDFGLENGTSYQYGLRTVVKIDAVVVESDMSEIITASPQSGL